MSGRSRRQITAHAAITRWVGPKDFEPAHGHLLRLAAAHDEWDARGFADHVGVGWVNDPSACLEAVGAARFATDADRERLARWTPVFGTGTATIAGQTFRTNDWSMAVRRRCPGCMAEEPYHRTWFDLTFIEECPVHGLPLLDAGGEPGNQFMRVDAVAEVTGRGTVRPAPRLPAPRDDLAAYALGRLGILPAIRDELLDPHEMRDVLEAVEAVGRLAVFGWREDLPRLGHDGVTAGEVRATGHRLLRAGTGALTELAGKVAGDAPAGTFGARRTLGWAAPRMVMMGPLARRVWETMTAVVTELGMAGRNYGRGIEPGVARLTLQEVATLNDLPRNVVTAVAMAGGHLAPHPGRKGTPHLVPKEEVDAVVGTTAQLMPKAAVAAALGIDGVMMAKLSATGRLPAFSAFLRSDGRSDVHHLGDYIGFLEAIPCVEIDHEPRADGGDDPYMPLGDALTLTRYDAVEAIEDIHAGVLTVYGRRGPRLGLNDFLIEPGAGDHGHPFTKRLFSPVITRVARGVPGGMTQREACALLDAPPETVLALAELGCFGGSGIGRGGSRRKLGRAGVEAFAAEWAAGKSYAGVLGVQASWVRTKLAERGILDLVVERGVDPRRLAPFYRRADMRRALGLARDPDGEDGRKAYWKRFSAFLEANRIGFGVWSTVDPTSTLCSTSDRAWPVHLTVHRALDRPACPANGTTAGHGIEAVLRIDASHDAARLGELAAASRERRFMRGIEHRFDEEAGTLVASLSTSVTVTGGPSTAVGEAVARVEAIEFGLMQRMLLTLRGSFETGTRPYDHRCFGAWPLEVPARL